MPGTREQARAFAALHAATDVSPTLTPAEVDLCLDQARVVDADGRLITDPLYTETIWFTRGVVLCLDAKLAKASAKTDLKADGTEIHASQVTANLERLRRSWRSRMLPGSI